MGMPQQKVKAEGGGGLWSESRRLLSPCPARGRAVSGVLNVMGRGPAEELMEAETLPAGTHTHTQCHSQSVLQARSVAPVLQEKMPRSLCGWPGDRLPVWL